MTLPPRAMQAAFDLSACLSGHMVAPSAQSEARLAVAADEMRAALDADGPTPLARLAHHLTLAGEEMVSIATTVQADAARADLLPFAAAALKSVIDAQEAVRALAAVAREEPGKPQWWGIVCLGYGGDTWGVPWGGEAWGPDPYSRKPGACRATFDARAAAEEAAVRHTAASGAEGTYRAALIVDVCVRCGKTRPIVGRAYCAPCRTATDEPADRDLAVVERYAAGRRGT